MPVEEPVHRSTHNSMTFSNSVCFVNVSKFTKVKLETYSVRSVLDNQVKPYQLTSCIKIISTITVEIKASNLYSHSQSEFRTNLTIWQNQEIAEFQFLILQKFEKNNF